MAKRELQVYPMITFFTDRDISSVMINLFIGQLIKKLFKKKQQCVLFIK